MATTTAAAAASALRALADRVGIIGEYRDQTGKETRATSDETRVALLAAMGIDASTDERAKRALEEMEEREQHEVLEPVRVAPFDEQRRELGISIGAGAGATPLDWSAELREENGAVHVANGRTVPGDDGRLHVSLPFAPGLGYHTLHVSTGGGKGERSAEQSLIVVPTSCLTPEQVLKGRKVFGITANLYTVRSARNWGVGDFTDLAALLRWAASVGAEFVGVNPLHALRNADGDISPYSPISRLFRNPLYIDVEAVPGFGASHAEREIIGNAQFQAELRRVRGSDHVEYEAVMRLKWRLMRELHAAHLRGPRDRNPDWQRWRASQGEALECYATFRALGEHLGRDGDAPVSWHEWPEQYRDPRSAAVRRFREIHEDEIDFHRWLQFVIDQQLAQAAKSARDAGMAIGLYQDLAIGTSPNGADGWANPDLFVKGVSIGAPPDPYSATGQNWGLPPIDPRALRRQRYEYWIQLVRSSLRHGGALRIDHVMGLFRQFWIPEGRSGTDGAYVRFPSDDLLGILALESTRAGALVVGEDLGTVPDDVPPAMRRWHLLSSKVLYFERDGNAFKPAASYDAESLATANTHDMPTLDGFWRARDVEIRRSVGLVESDAAAREARATRDEEKRALLERLTADELLSPEQADELSKPEPAAAARAALRGAVHEFLCRTPAALVGLSLDDIVGEAEPVNVPGVGSDKFASWSRRLSLPIEKLASDPSVAATLRCHRSPREGR
ncbi:MAG: 4-alpha-glucanotransferase [Gemmatimonadaceae bacterium]